MAGRQQWRVAAAVNIGEERKAPKRRRQSHTVTVNLAPVAQVSQPVLRDVFTDATESLCLRHDRLPIAAVATATAQQRR